MKILKIMLIVFFFFTAFACIISQGKTKGEYAGISAKRSSEKQSTGITYNKENKKTIPCVKLIVEIVRTSPRYIEITKGLKEEIIKNGGLSYGITLESSPHPAHDKICCYSKTYDFAVNEIYTSRQLSIARFSFNPENQHLYEYDAVLGKKMIIDFDEDLLLSYNASCN